MGDGLDERERVALALRDLGPRYRSTCDARNARVLTAIRRRSELARRRRRRLLFVLALVVGEGAWSLLAVATRHWLPAVGSVACMVVATVSLLAVYRTTP